MSHTRRYLFLFFWTWNEKNVKVFFFASLLAYLIWHQYVSGTARDFNLLGARKLPLTREFVSFFLFSVMKISKHAVSCLILKSGRDPQPVTSRWWHLAFLKNGGYLTDWALVAWGLCWVLVIRKVRAELHMGNVQGVVFEGTPERNRNVSEQAQPGLLANLRNRV